MPAKPDSRRGQRRAGRRPRTRSIHAWPRAMPASAPRAHWPRACCSRAATPRVRCASPRARTTARRSSPTTCACSRSRRRGRTSTPSSARLRRRTRYRRSAATWRAPRSCAAPRAVARHEDARPLLETVPIASRYASRARHMRGLITLERGETAEGRRILETQLESDTAYAGRREVALAIAGVRTGLVALGCRARSLRDHRDGLGAASSGARAAARPRRLRPLLGVVGVRGLASRTVSSSTARRATLAGDAAGDRVRESHGASDSRRPAARLAHPRASGRWPRIP